MNISVTSPLERVIAKEEKQWHPNPKQKRFMELSDDFHEAGYGGSLMSGKSEIGMLLPALYRLYERPQFRGLFLRRTFPELEQEVIPRTQEYFPSLGAKYNIAKHRWEWPNGAMYLFGHLQEEKDVKKYDTGQFPYIFFDEATSFTGTQYEYMTLRRNRSPVGYGKPAITRWGSNPGNVGHRYFRERFIDPCPEGNKRIIDPKTGASRIFVPAKPTDNKWALKENPEYFARLQGLSSEAERKAVIEGDWYTFEGQVFDEFRIFPMSDEPENAQHVVSPFTIPDWWPKLIAIDWGFNAWCFIIWCAISPDGKVYIYRTYAVKKLKIREWTRDLAILSAGEVNEIRDVRICWSAVQDTGRDQTIFEQTAEALLEAGFKCGLTRGDKNRVAGKQLIHEYLRWKPLKTIKQLAKDFNQQIADRIKRVSGNDTYLKYLESFQEERQEHNIPRLQIFSHSPEGRENKELIDCIPQCVYDEKSVEDVKEFKGDDPYDCLRILLNSVRDYFEESKGQYAKHERLSLIAKKYAEGDQTSFYQVCERAEQDNKEVTSVRRMSGMRRSGRSNRSSKGFSRN